MFTYQSCLAFVSALNVLSRMSDEVRFISSDQGVGSVLCTMCPNQCASLVEN